MDDDVRNQITREDILDAMAALDRGEPHTFGPSAFESTRCSERGRYGVSAKQDVETSQTFARIYLRPAFPSIRVT
jgi:hypothetical protein